MERLLRFLGDDYMAPHGFCFFWLPEILWLHIISHLLIAVSYFSIPVALWYFARKRPDMPFRRLFFLFASFITLCGLTHLFGLFVLWFPYYGIQGIVMLVTGIVSALTAFLVWKIMPAALTLPSPSALRELNEQLQASNTRIEEIVKDRTQELEAAIAELTVARKNAEEASMAKTEFLTNMSHEIRTPMNVIIGITRIIEESGDISEKQAQHLRMLKTSTDSLMALINDLLDVSKIEARTLELEKIPFRIADLIADTVTMFQWQAQAKNLNFSYHLASECIRDRFYLGDPNRLRQIMLNLCGNAMKFTEHGGITIAIDCNEGSDALHDKVIITVQDTGVGIPPEKLEAIFEKFVQADTSVTRKYGGTGLGLTISRSLARLMNGDIAVESTLGEGSRFTLSLELPVAPEHKLS